MHAFLPVWFGFSSTLHYTSLQRFSITPCGFIDEVVQTTANIVKILLIWTPKTFAKIVLQNINGTVWFYDAIDADGIAKSPPWSDY